MKTGTGVIIGVVITILLTIVLVVGGLVGGFFYLADLGNKRNARETEQAKIDGREFGKTTNENGCMEKAFSLKSDILSDFPVTKNFVQVCLKSSQPTPNFCDGVPTYDSNSDWNDKQCEKVPNKYSCVNAIYAKQSYCSYERDKKK